MSITIRSIGPTDDTFFSNSVNHSVCGRTLSLAASADFVRQYAGAYAGVWRSDDAGHTWRQLTHPQPEAGQNPDVPGALGGGTIFDLAVSPVDPDLVLAGCVAGEFAATRDGLYRSTDGGATWTRVLTTLRPDQPSHILFAPDDPQLVFAAIGSTLAVSRDAGASWQQSFIGGTVWHLAVARKETSGVRRVYAAGNARMFRSIDGGATWREDQGATTIRNARAALAAFQLASGSTNPIGTQFAMQTTDVAGSSPSVLVVDPDNNQRVYLAAPGGSFGPSYYNKENTPPDGTPCNTLPERLAGEGSLWYGNYDGFDATGAARWVQLPGPPVYTGGGQTPSGNAIVVARKTSASYLLCFADQSTVHVSRGKPTGAASWHRLDGRDVSAGKLAGDNSNKPVMHVDPHAILLTADFTLKASTGVVFPYNQNSVLDQFITGTIWIANDGGVVWSDDGGRQWSRARGLETLDAVNIAGVFGLGNAPALYMGLGDNDDFFTVDGGAHWRDPLSSCGDCDAWFADVAQPRRVLEFDPRGAGLRLITSFLGLLGYPDAADPGRNRTIPRPRNSNASSGFVLQGFNPVIRTLASEAPLSDGDYVFVGDRADGVRVLLRTRAISTITSVNHWDIPLFAEQIGPPLPAGANIIQTSGGHANPVFYAFDGPAPGFGHVFKLDASRTQWTTIVPGGPPGRSTTFALRFFVDPFNPQLIYVVDNSGVTGDPGIRVSLDGGATWLSDPGLAAAVTMGGLLSSPTGNIIKDMLFVRGEPLTRFAFGRAGVMCTVDGGLRWRPLLNSLALPGLAETGFFNPVSNGERALYVVCQGRGVLKLSPVPAPQLTPPPVFGLAEMAAILSDA